MQVFIHAGAGKTGSSSIQRFFADKYEHLIEHQVLYPRAGRHSELTNAHHAFFLSFLNEVQTGFVKPYQPRYKPEYYARQIFGEAKQFGANKILISSEYLFTSYFDLNLLKEIKNNMGRGEVFFVIVLRRPSHFVVSLYNQSIKGLARRTISASAFVAEIRGTGILDFDRRISQFEEIFGSDKVLVRWYEYINDNIVSHFLNILSVDYGSPVLQSLRVNSSIDWPTVQAYRMVNRLPRGRAHARRLVDRLVASVPESIRTGTLARACAPFDAATLEALDREYAESHARLSRRKGLAPPPHARED